MIVILGSKNPSKKRAVEDAFRSLGIIELEVLCVDSKSGVSSRPIGFEIVRGADNRNQNSRKYAIQNEISYDYLCAIEGGFSLDENGLPFVVTYAILEDNKGRKSTGKSLGLRISKDMFDYVRDGGSLNELITDITGENANKELQGIMGYLTNGILRRDSVDKEAVVSSLIPFVFRENRDLLSERIEKRNIENNKRLEHI